MESFANAGTGTGFALRVKLSEIIAFTGLNGIAELRSIARAHVIAWRTDLERRGLASSRIRRKLSSGHLLMRWRNAIPEFVKIPGVEEGDCFDDLRVLHLKIPGVGIVIALAVSHRGFGIKQDDDGIAI